MIEQSVCKSDLSPSQRSSQGVILTVAFSWRRGRGVETPPGLQGLGHLPGLGEAEVTGLLGHDGALVLGAQLGHQLRHVATRLLGVEVTHLLGHVHRGGDHLLVALLGPLLVGAAGAADLDGQLLARGVAHELAGLLLHVLGGAGGLVHGAALLGSLAVTHLLHGSVALLHSLVEGFLFEGDGAGLLEVLLADLLLAGLELGDVGVVALLRVLVGALQDGLLLQSGHLLLLQDAAHAAAGVHCAPSEVNTATGLEWLGIIQCINPLTPAIIKSVVRDVIILGVVIIILL